MYSDAILSEDGLYRYWLTRVWDETKPVMAFIMLNPSKADHHTNDPTVRECMSIARRWHYGGITVGNLFAWRATHPTNMMSADVTDPVGPENDDYLLRISADHNMIICAWGTNGGYRGRDKAVMDLLNRTVHCLGLTKKGFPFHPLGSIGAIKLQEYVYDTGRDNDHLGSVRQDSGSAGTTGT